MNIIYKIFLCTFSIIATSIQARIGCMDNSNHLEKFGDTKSYHYVACTCPCQRYKQLADRNTCTKCGHYHDNSPFIIIHAPKIIQKNQ